MTVLFACYEDLRKYEVALNKHACEYIKLTVCNEDLRKYDLFSKQTRLWVYNTDCIICSLYDICSIQARTYIKLIVVFTINIYVNMTFTLLYSTVIILILSQSVFVYFLQCNSFLTLYFLQGDDVITLPANHRQTEDKVSLRLTNVYIC